LLQRHEFRGSAGKRLGRAGVLLLVLAFLPLLAAASRALRVEGTSGPNGGALATSSGPSFESTSSSSGSSADGSSSPLGPLGDPSIGTAGDPSNSETLFLEVLVNGHPVGKIGEFTLRAGKLMARPEELRDLGFRVPEYLVLEPHGLIPLAVLPGVTFTIDQRNQLLRVTALDSSLIPAVLQPEDLEAPGGRRVIESGKGMTLNYDLVGTLQGGRGGGSGTVDMRAFTPWGVASSGWLGYAGSTPGATGTNTAIRLDSAYTFADVNTLRRYSLGDFINSSLSWTRPVHLEGVQIRSDFSMRPDLVTFPLPALTGSAAVPSTVDVLANGNLIMSRQVDAGPFEVPQLPTVTGAGMISMTMTNSLGQQVNVTQPFYASASLLKPGLQTFSGQAGLVRRNWGAVSNDYGKMAVAGIYRRGLSSKFTFESSFEGTSGAVMGGVGGAAAIASLGELTFAAAPSFGSGHAGAQISAGAQRIGRRFSLGGSATIAGRAYRDVASVNGAGVPRKQLSAFTSFSSKRYGSIGAAYAGVDEDASPAQVLVADTPSTHSHVLSVNYSRQIGRVSVYASEYKSIGAVAGAASSNGFQVGLTVPFGRRRSANISATSDGNGQVQVQQSATRVGDWGYQAYASAGSSNHEFGQVEYKSPAGMVIAGVDTNAGETTLRLESQAAISLVDRGLFASNTIYDSFAIVDTSPMPHVRVLQENRDVGKTDRSGRLLVPDMRSFDLNHLAIEPTDVPADATVNVAVRQVRPQDRSGVVVKFAIKFSHGALLQLVNETGAPLPVGSAATLKATGAAAPVGYDGDVYVEDLSPHNELTVEGNDGRRCTVAFDYKPVHGEIPLIGPLPCVEKRP
jgi:outer membrane usher protein